MIPAMSKRDVSDFRAGQVKCSEEVDTYLVDDKCSVKVSDILLMCSIPRSSG